MNYFMDEETMSINSYIVKPVDFDRFLEVAAQIELYWTVLNQPPP